ncbi:MAG: CBS domain-containing protein [Saprospiraceae bacterium]|nr:CBS domain-containing protein [Saprospiraceae bacterium]
MYASELISYSVPPLKLSDTGVKALLWMNDFHVRHLPVINDGKLLGILSEDEVLNFLVAESTIKESKPVLLHKFVPAQQHLYDIMKLVVNFNLTIIPVINNEEEYMGLITIEDLIKKLADTGSITHPGGVLVLEMGLRDYSLSEISRIIEMENATILSSFISSPYGNDSIELTLKLNKEDLKHIVATLERFNYTVKSSFYESEFIDTLNDRYESLMRFLDV